LGRAAGDGLVGGGLSELTGGNFKDGFIGAAVGSALSPLAANTSFGRQVIGSTVLGRTAFAAAVGGTAAELTGGKFANGAVTSAFMHIVNAEIGEALTAPKSRSLTTGEIQLAKSVFGDSIDYTKVKVFGRAWISRIGQGQSVVTPNGNIYQSGLGVTDFSQGGWDALFIHEMTHVYQYQHGIDPVMGRLKSGNYNPGYPLSATKTWDSYGTEQQATIIEDYYSATKGRTIYQGRGRNGVLYNDNGGLIKGASVVVPQPTPDTFRKVIPWFKK
jgi:hypothetical protein